MNSSTVFQQSSPSYRSRRRAPYSKSQTTATTSTNRRQELRQPPFSPRARNNRLNEVNSQRMFVYGYTKAEVEILDSAEDDKLAASIYGDINTKERSSKSKKQQNDEYNFGVSGYDFDSLLEDNSSHSTNTDVRESSSSYIWHHYR
mmetsp:Transcript_15441/g.31984  ORF Transcript_15441/g.31984 Transcript_15441/m.31984 type:complete len:146 (-) Transcript_15441:64-501(-)